MIKLSTKYFPQPQEPPCSLWQMGYSLTGLWYITYLCYLPRIVVDVGDEPAFFGVVDLAYFIRTKPVDELS